MTCLQVLLGLMVLLPTVLGIPGEDCKDFIFNINGVNYIRENLLSGILKARTLSYDRTTNTLFFKYQAYFTLNTALPAKLNLNTNELQTIEGFKSVVAVSVDAKTNDVYINGDKGIYKYDKVNNTLELNSATNESLSFNLLIFTKANVFYLTTSGTETLFKIENGDISLFENPERIAATDLVIDDDDNMFFINRSGLYRQKLGGEEAVYYESWIQPGTAMELRGLTLNNVGDVYAFSESYGIYAFNKNTTKLNKVLDVHANGLTFDSDNNMIYSDYNNLYRLKPKPNADPNCIYNHYIV